MYENFHRKNFMKKKCFQIGSEDGFLTRSRKPIFNRRTATISTWHEVEQYVPANTRYRLLKYDSYVRPSSTSAVSNLSFFCSFLCNVYPEASGARWKTNDKAQKPKIGHSWGSNALPFLSWTGVAQLMYIPLYCTHLCCVHTFALKKIKYKSF